MALIDKLTAIGDAIREKNGTTDLIPLVDMPQAILDIVSGGGAQYTSVVYKEDDTISLIDIDGITHTMTCIYEDDKLIGVTYDSKSVELTYNGDTLVSVGKTLVNLESAKCTSLVKLDHTVTFAVDNEPYEVVSVKNGNELNAPYTTNQKTYVITGWFDNDRNEIMFPYKPERDITLNALTSTLENVIYNFYGVSKSEYPVLVIEMRYSASGGFNPYIYFGTAYEEYEGGKLSIESPCCKGNGSFIYASEITEKTIYFFAHKTMKEITSVTSSNGAVLNCLSGSYYVVNIPLQSTEYSATMLRLGTE